MLNGWLLIGRSGKRDDQPTPLGRLPVGNKGLGRLAALRLGDVATVISCTKEEPETELELTIDSRAYDAASSVDEVGLKIVELRRERLASTGTLILVQKLHRQLKTVEVKRLSRSMCLLADPFAGTSNGFRPRLDSDEFREMARLVEEQYFEDAETHLVASLDAEGQASARVLDWQGGILYERTSTPSQASGSSTGYNCPPAKFELWTFKLSGDNFRQRTHSMGEVQAWLAVSGGVHLYIRGFRVSPYGDRGNDWLDLNLRRARSPEFRPSTNNSIGRISVEDGSGRLRQKTDRSGLIANVAFEELQRFAQDALDWMARKQLETREKARIEEKEAAAAEAEEQRKPVAEAIESLKPSDRPLIQKAFADREKAFDRERATLKKEVQLYRTLSTAGITAAIFAHEAKSPIATMKRNLTLVRSALERSGPGCLEPVERPLDRLLKLLATLRALSSLTLKQISKDKRRARRIELHAFIRSVTEMLAPFAAERGVLIELDLAAANPFLHTSPAAIESVLTNVIANSLQSFASAAPGDWKVLLATTVEGGTCFVRCEDSGPGLSGVQASEAWLPGVTTRDDGTGLGLTIVRDTMRDLGGSATIRPADRLGGFCMELLFPVLGES